MNKYNNNTNSKFTDYNDNIELVCIDPANYQFEADILR